MDFYFGEAGGVRGDYLDWYLVPEKEFIGIADWGRNFRGDCFLCGDQFCVMVVRPGLSENIGGSVSGVDQRGAGTAADVDLLQKHVAQRWSFHRIVCRGAESHGSRRRG